jgi:hypothetical protein
MRYFFPSPRQTNFLILTGCAAVAFGFYLRHSILDAQPLIAACAAGAPRAACSIRQFLIELYEMQFFGGVALVAAILHFARPRLVMFAVALAASCLGLFLSNTGAAALAVGILLIAFARPAHASRLPPMQLTPPRTTKPASSRTTH